MPPPMGRPEDFKGRRSPPFATQPIRLRCLTFPEQKQRDVRRARRAVVEAKGFAPALEAISASFQMFSRR